jgi:8-oxo-dGTP pyrophosphatase MutT (NUDIX family)
MPVHGGQIALPGGGCRSGESTTACALREAEEELGISAADVTILGQLRPVFIFSSNFLAHPVVAAVDRLPEFRPCPREVAGILQVHTEQLVRDRVPHVTHVRRHRLRFRAPSLPLGNAVVWGATSIILGQLASVFETS